MDDNIISKCIDEIEYSNHQYARKKILICPLNWGLGHATRCVPIIRNLISIGHEPVIVADGYSLKFLQLEFPALRFIDYASYKVKYSSGKSQITAMLIAFPSIIFGIIKEHRWLKRLLETEHFDQIISDNRFGLWHKNVPSIYITHQLMVKMPRGLKLLEPVIWVLNRIFIHKYNECWIPDDTTKKLTGDLAHKYKLPKNAKFIGLQSRFSFNNSIIVNNAYKVVAIVSGIEPQRSIFENFLIEKFREKDYKTLLISGQPGQSQTNKRIGNLEITSHLNSHDLAAILLGTEKIVCRSGYSTIMDLEALKCLYKAEFIPTPGQTEQEYLATLDYSKLQA